MNRKFLFQILLGSWILAEALLYAGFTLQNISEWHNYYIIYLYTPIIVFRTILGIMALGYLPTATRHSFFDLFSTNRFYMFARYNQAGLFLFIVFSLLNIRPFYLVWEVDGWGNSPCGASSCTRNQDLDLQFAVPYAVYNPKGWFPNGKHERYQTDGTARYVFCNYRDQCRWADYDDTHIRSYAKLAGGCELQYDSPIPNEKGFMSSRIKDYRNKGKGVLNGYAPCKRVGQSFPCRGVSTQVTLATNVTKFDATFTEIGQGLWKAFIQKPNDILELIGKSGLKHFKGKHVCSVCAQYDNAPKNVLPNQVSSLPRFPDPDTECVPNSDGSINALCSLCPGEGGSFGSPFNSFDTETVQIKNLKTILLYCVVFSLFPCFSFPIFYHFVTYPLKQYSPV